MSGLGSRFLEEGYKLPKPLIEVDNKEIISHVLNIFPEIYSVLFICNEEHLNNQVFQFSLYQFLYINKKSEANYL